MLILLLFLSFIILCWNTVSGLDNVEFFPPPLKKNNLYSALTEARNYEFDVYIDSLFLTQSINIRVKNICSSKLHDNNFDQYAIAGEVIIYYKDLILETYKVH